MKNSSLTLYLEINNLSFIFLVGESDEYDQFKIVHKLELPIRGIENNKITDLEEVSDIIKKNIYIIEQELNHTFKEVILILENFDLTFINLSGFKKLNGSQILRENITYILNTLKSCVDKTELKKTILHIFNSKFYLDNKKVDNLPIGLFGDSYSHELSFTLINSNDHKNFKSIFDKSNLKIKKILIKSFINGVNIINNYKSDTFIHIKIDKNDTKIFYFENNSLKFEENFKFGNDIVIKDISKITLLNIDNIKIILDKIESLHEISEEDLIEQNFFKDNSYRKIKKKLIYEIASARIKEISEIILFRNVNFVHFSKISNNIYLELDRKLQSKCLKEIYKTVFSINEKYNTEFINFSSENMLDTAHKLVHFGWKKEAIPISKTKKSFIAALFDRIFG
jgi:cell division protein FtsA